MRLFILCGGLLLFSFHAMAQNCPVGQSVQTEGLANLSFQWSLDAKSRSKNCRVLNPEALRDHGARIVGCSGSNYILEPLAPISTDCFAYQPARVSLPASAFQAPVPEIIPPAPAISDSREIGRGTYTPPLTALEREEVNREMKRSGDSLAVFMDDLHHEGTGIKSSQEIKNYHDCLLSEGRYMRNGKEVDLEKAQREAYNESFRANIGLAYRHFGVPVSLLSCTCGRESRFNADLRHGKGAAGACQATGAFVDEVNRFINKDPKVRREWQAYLSSVKLESPDCAKTPITKDRVVACPSLAIGTTAIYMRHIMGRLIGYPDLERMSPLDWEKQNLNTYVALSGAFNVGVTFADEKLSGVSNREDWDRVLLAKTCNWLVRSEDPAERARQAQRAQEKFQEARGHLIAIRNCLQKGSNLNHQGKPMGGACALPAGEQQKQLKDFENYKARLPASCQNLRSTPSSGPIGTSGTK